jgi:Secretion system C-terminal sorting domain
MNESKPYTISLARRLDFAGQSGAMMLKPYVNSPYVQRPDPGATSTGDEAEIADVENRLLLDYRYSSYTNPTNPGNPGTGGFNSSHNALRPSDSGWAGAMPAIGGLYTGGAYSVDPNSGMAGGIVHSQESKPYAFTLDAGDQRIYGETVQPIPFNDVVFVAPGVLLAIGGNHVLRLDHGVVYDGLELPPARNARYRRLLGERFVRSYPVDSLSGEEFTTPKLRVDLYSLGLSALRTVDLVPPTRYHDYSLLQRPSDSTIFILWGSDEGIHCTILEQELGVIVADTLISATTGPARHPSFVFRGDTLYAAWEDPRNTDIDIYGIGWRLPSERRGLSAPGISVPELATELTIVQAVPNPVREVLTLSVKSRTTQIGSVEIVDPLGRIMRRIDQSIPSGTSALTLDLGGLPSGMYTVAVTASGVRAAEKVVVMGR